MDKRERIIQSAINNFLSRGIHQTTISHIVKGAGIAQGTFYLYFPSKMSLMPAIAEVMVQKILDEIKTQVDENESTANQLKQIIATIFNLYETYHDLHSLMYAGLASSEHLKKWETVYEPIYEYMKYWLIIAKAKGDIRDTINEKETAKLMIGLIESAAEQIYIYDESSHVMAQQQQVAVYDFISHALN